MSLALHVDDIADALHLRVADTKWHRERPEPELQMEGAIVEALRCKAEGRSETILFNLCGHGHFDMSAYTAYFGGKLVDQQYDEKELAMALAGLPSVPA